MFNARRWLEAIEAATDELVLNYAETGRDAGGASPASALLDRYLLRRARSRGLADERGPYEALNSVGGQLSIVGGGVGLATLSLGAATGVNLHALELTSNPSLVTWNNANWHVLGSGPITITGNGSLPSCAAENFVATQQGSGWTGSATLAGNPVCP